MNVFKMVWMKTPITGPGSLLTPNNDLLSQDIHCFFVYQRSPLQLEQPVRLQKPDHVTWLQGEGGMEWGRQAEGRLKHEVRTIIIPFKLAQGHRVNK